MHLHFLDVTFLQPLATALCWTLVHSIWQGLIAAIAASLVLFLTRKSRPAVRYNLLTGLFVLFALAAAVTFVYECKELRQAGGTATSFSQKAASGSELKSPSSPSNGGRTNATATATTSETTNGTARVTTSATTNSTRLLTDLLSRNAVPIMAIWCFVLALRIFRMSCTLLYTRHIKRHRSHYPSEELSEKLASLAARLHIQKTVTLLESEVIKMPAVFGHLKPVIFVPLGLLTHLPGGEVEAILIHELAHIRRNDFLVNLLQSIVETLFFFNPAATWLSSLIREAREHCCDDIALEQTHDKQQFVRALIHCLTRATGNHPDVAIGFLGRRNAFVGRVARLVHNRNKALNKAEGFFLGLSFIDAGLLTVAFTEGRGTVPAIQAPARAAGISAPKTGSPSSTEPKSNYPKTHSPGIVKPTQYPARDTVPYAMVDSTWGPFHEMRINDSGDIVVEVAIRGVDYRLTRNNGVITELDVDHQKIPPSDIQKYNAITDEICQNVEAYFARLREQHTKLKLAVSQGDARQRADIMAQIDADRARENTVLRQPGEIDASHSDPDPRRAKLAEIRTQMQNLAQEAALLEQSIAEDDQQHRSDKSQQDLRQRQLDLKATQDAQQDLRQKVQDLQQQRIDLQERIDADMKKEKMVKAIMSEIVDEHLVEDRESLKTFSLNNEEMIINGVKLPAEVHQRFKTKYLNSPTDRYNLVND